jgi:hypothetical protein
MRKGIVHFIFMLIGLVFFVYEAAGVILSVNHFSHVPVLINLNSLNGAILFVIILIAYTIYGIYLAITNRLYIFLHKVNK